MVKCEEPRVVNLQSDLNKISLVRPSERAKDSDPQIPREKRNGSLLSEPTRQRPVLTRFASLRRLAERRLESPEVCPDFRFDK